MTDREKELEEALDDLLNRAGNILTDDQLSQRFRDGKSIRDRWEEYRKLAPVRPVGKCDECGEPTYFNDMRPWACSSRCYAYIMGITDPDY